MRKNKCDGESVENIVTFWCRALKLLKVAGAFQTQCLCKEESELGAAKAACHWFVKHGWVHELGEGVYTAWNGPMED